MCDGHRRGKSVLSLLFSHITQRHMHTIWEVSIFTVEMKNERLIHLMTVVDTKGKNYALNEEVEEHLVVGELLVKGDVAAVVVLPRVP